MESSATVYIVDDDSTVRDALGRLLESVDQPCETFASAAAFLEAYDPSRPGCLLTDVRMPVMSGLELQRRISADGCSLPVIIMTGHGDIPMAAAAMRRGAVDFIEKPFNEQVLLDCVHRAIGLDGEHRGRALQLADIHARLERLTPREREILDLVVAGRRNKVIAGELAISQSTVEAHRAKVMEKIQAESLSDLMRMMLSLQS